MSKARVEALEREVALLRATVARMRQDPGECPVLACDNSCVCASPVGMAPNGGCRCDERKLRRAVQFWRARAAYLTDCVKLARDADLVEKIAKYFDDNGMEPCASAVREGRWEWPVDR